MAHVLLVQEFGSNLGHVNRLLAVARALPPHRFTVVVPHPEVTAARVRDVLGAQVDVLQAPRFSAPDIVWPPARPERTLADIFHALGYGLVEPLAAAALAWRDLIDRLRPDLIVSDFAPTLRLGNPWGVPVVAVGDCFNLPPPGGLCPPIMPSSRPDPASASAERALVDAARTVAGRLGSAPVDSFAALFAGDVAFPLGIRLLDPYAATRTGLERPSISLPAIRSGPAFEARTGPPIFCYLWAEHPALNAVVSALNRLPVRSMLHVRGIDPATLAAHCAPQVGVRTTEAEFAAVLPQSRIFIHYGGGGACFAGLLAGTLQVVLPTSLEQESGAARLAGAGVALAMRLAPGADPDALARHLAVALNDTARQQAALRLAADYAVLPPVDTLADIAAACARLLDVGPRGPLVTPSGVPRR